MRSDYAQTLIRNLPMPRRNFEAPADADSKERLVAKHRERIIQLEAHGAPFEDSDELWDVLEGILAEVKRHRAVIDPEA